MFFDDGSSTGGTSRTSSRGFENNDLLSLIPALRAFARGLCRNRNDADDLVQETLTKALANAHRFESGTQLKSWLFTIMRNTFFNQSKKTARERPGTEDCVAMDVSCLPTQEWSRRSSEMARALGALPSDQREVLVLIGMLGLGYEETAEICDCAVGTIKSRLHRGRHRLQELIGGNPIVS